MTGELLAGSSLQLTSSAPTTFHAFPPLMTRRRFPADAGRSGGLGSTRSGR